MGRCYLEGVGAVRVVGEFFCCCLSVRVADGGQVGVAGVRRGGRTRRGSRHAHVQLLRHLAGAGEGLVVGLHASIVTSKQALGDAMTEQQQQQYLLPENAVEVSSKRADQGTMDTKMP